MSAVPSPVAESTRTRRGHDAWLFVALFVFVGITRAPFLSMTLAGEEGANARGIAMVAHGRLPRMVIARSAHGQELEIPAGHNLGGYLVPGALFAPVLRWTGFSTLAQRTRAAIGLRACYVLIYAGALMLALQLVDPTRRLRGAALLAALTLPTLPLLGSVQVNYDGAVTVLLVISTLLLFRRAVRRERFAWAAAAGVLLSFGKLEFTMAVGTALLITEALSRRWRGWLVFAATLFAATLIWRRLDPANFNYGYDVIGRFWALQGGTQAPLLSRALTYGRAHLDLLWPVYAALVLALVHLAVRREHLRDRLPVLLSLCFILAGYHAIAWRGDNFPRYFAACFPLAAILLAELEAPLGATLAAAGLVLAIAAPGYARDRSVSERALSLRIGSARDDLALARELEDHPRDCITVTDMDSGVSFYSARSSFACCFAQWSEWPREQGERLCP